MTWCIVIAVYFGKFVSLAVKPSQILKVSFSQLLEVPCCLGLSFSKPSGKGVARNVSDRPSVKYINIYSIIPVTSKLFTVRIREILH